MTLWIIKISEDRACVCYSKPNPMLSGRGWYLAPCDCAHDLVDLEVVRNLLDVDLSGSPITSLHQVEMQRRLRGPAIMPNGDEV